MTSDETLRLLLVDHCHDLGQTFIGLHPAGNFYIYDYAGITDLIAEIPENIQNKILRSDHNLTKQLIKEEL